ncbi:hypothetical protein LguiB_034898 [Lonicera macranthoides]
MGNGSNRSGDGLEEASSLSLDCDFGLGLKMQNTESYPHLPYHHPDPHTTTSSGFNGSYGGRGGPVSFGTYDDAVGAAGSVLQRTLHPFTSDTSFKSSGKTLFTTSQWQELERQTMIYKYMMASVPVPPQLLLPFTKTPSLSQSNKGVLDLRFSSGSDLEPWRCRRTDGKKWRCSRDVAPEQKYCERHAHKTRTRSRKPVENQTQNTTTTTTKTFNNYSHQPNILPAYSTTTTTTTTTDPFQKPISHFQTLPSSATSFDQARCIEWFMKGGTSILPLSSTSNRQQWPSSRIGFKRDITDHTKNPPLFPQYEEEPQTPINFNSYRFESHQLIDCSLLNPNPHDTPHTTRRFIDAWSTQEREDLNSVGNKCSVSSSARKLPPSSLTLSMSGADGIDEDNTNAQLSAVEMEEERGLLKSHWLNPAMWMGSPPPGGPLGEALCLGVAGNMKGVAGSNVASPHGCSNSNSTSSCSKSSCEDGGQGLNFH